MHSPNERAFALPLPITSAARQQADQFAAQQPTPQKAAQVRLNTIAVCVINDYLQLLGFTTNLTASDSWNRVLQVCADVADLEVVGIGRLECRPLLPDAPSAYVPPEVWEDRVGYAVVQIDASYQTAVLLGFVPTVVEAALPLPQLLPPEVLLDHLNALLGRQVATQTATPAVAPAVVQTRVQTTPPVTVPVTLVNLNQWWQNVFETGWQTVDALFESVHPSRAYAFRNAKLDDGTRADETAKIKRAKQIALGLPRSEQSIALVLELTPAPECETHLLLQVYPMQESMHLPPGLQVTVLDESGTAVLEVQSREDDNYIQLQFSGQSGESFGVQLALGAASVREAFVL